VLGVKLFFIGGLLVVNGVGLTGRINPKDCAPFSLLVGLLSLTTNVIALTRGSEAADFAGVGGGLLFAFTYLYLAVVQWRGLEGVGFGWYCLFVAVSALVFAGAKTDDWRVMAMWLLWASLWFLFYLAQGLGKNLPFLGGYTIIIGLATCWLPGIIMMLGLW